MIDWLAASVSILAVLEAAEGSEVESPWHLFDDINGTVGLRVAHVAQTIVEHFAPGVFLYAKQGRGTFYQWRVNLENEQGEKVGQVEFGGAHTLRVDGTATARIEFTGQGCRMYEASSGSDHAKRWSLLASLLGCCDARITRIDLAADDFGGTYPIAWALDQYNAGAFDRRGQRPKARLIDDMGNGTGKTLYIGSRSSENQLRAYEKGREQGDPESPWMRYEGEFHASNRRELPLEMLTDGAPYLVGAYPVLDFVDGIGERLRIAMAECAANCVRAVMHFRRQYGPMLNAMLHAAKGDESTLARLVVGTARAKLPAWCPQPEQASQLLATILFAPEGQLTVDETDNKPKEA